MRRLGWFFGLLSIATACAAAPPSASPSERRAEHAMHGPSPASFGFSVGHRQSPIDIVRSRVIEADHSMALRYLASHEHLVNRGHTVELTYDPGSSVAFDGTEYRLVQLHSHTPAEHLLDGKLHPLELHLVHESVADPEQKLVIGILFAEGEEQPLLERLASDAPRLQGAEVDSETRLNAGSLLPRDAGFFEYNGSLTTPPYSETVTWLVLDHPEQASKEEIARFESLEGNNARHVQQLWERPIHHFAQH